MNTGQSQPEPLARAFLFVPGQRPSADEVRTARATAGLTQAEAAKLVHYTRSTSWAAVEQGRQQMDPARWHLFLLLTGLQPLRLSRRVV